MKYVSRIPTVGAVVLLGVGAYAMFGVQSTVTETASFADGSVAVLSSTVAEKEDGLQTLVDTDFSMKIQETERVLLDVRTPEEYAEGHLEGAQLIDFYGPTFETQLEALDREASYAVYCRSGNRSGQVLARMRELGFIDVVDLEGGIVAWQKNGNALCTTC